MPGSFTMQWFFKTIGMAKAASSLQIERLIRHLTVHLVPNGCMQIHDGFILDPAVTVDFAGLQILEPLDQWVPHRQRGQTFDLLPALS